MEASTDNREATTFDFKQDVHVEDYRAEDRRWEVSEGYTCISIVGWICRRERFRRKNAARQRQT